jgi:hypothetical protein
MEGLDERSAHTSDRSDTRGAWRRACMCVKHMKTQGDWEWERHKSAVFVC